MFPNDNLHNTKAPLPDLDNTELCNEEQITKYMSIIGQLQWAVTLGRFDILAHEMSMSSLAPNIGFLERLYGYFQKPNTLLLGTEPKNPITLINQYKNMIGLEQFMRMSEKKSQ